MINREVIESILPHEQASKLVQSDEDKLSVAIERPPNLPGNQLGLTSIDLNELNPRQAILVERGQRVELNRGNTGFDPNTVQFLWQPEGLSLDGLATIVRNYAIWNH